MGMLEVARATVHDADAVAATLDVAFRDDPVSGWLFPDEADRARLHPGFMALFVELALASGEVYLTEGAGGVAIWFAVDPDAAPEPDDVADRIAVHCGIYAPRFRQFHGIMAKHHPATEPHSYLNFLAVRPPLQGHGIGTALLRDRFRQLDADGVPAYLEAGSTRSAALYEREGFTRTGLLPLADDGPALIPMWRPARRPTG